jgi:hypothetical protein
MPDELKQGDRVESTPQGKTRGTVERTLTEEMWIDRHKVFSSPGNPEYLVRSEKSGDLAAHEPSALRKLPKRD